MNQQRDTPILIGSFATLQWAELAAGLLRNNGIPCEVTNSTIASVLPLTETWTPLQLLVPGSMADRAAALLREHGDIE